MANIGYLQVVRHCNHYCGFCSNPSTPFEHTLESMRELVDDLVARGYFGVVLTGGEPSLHPELPKIARSSVQTWNPKVLSSIESPDSHRADPSALSDCLSPELPQQPAQDVPRS
jgi:organic radical activating enzyme